MGQQLFLTRRRRLERDSRTPYQQPFILYRHNYILPVGRCYPDLACRCSLYPEHLPFLLWNRMYKASYSQRPEAEMDYRGGDEFVKLQTASEENSMTGRATNKSKSGREKYLNASRVQNKWSKIKNGSSVTAPDSSWPPTILTVPEVTKMQRSWRGSLLYRERSGGKGIRKRRNEHLPGKQDHGQ